LKNVKAEAIQGRYASNPLSGEQGIFAPLLKHFLESPLAGELESHLRIENASGNNNGKTSKTVKSLSEVNSN
jgi:hypothetical protein